MTDLTDFGVTEPQESLATPEKDEERPDTEAVWSVCVDCEHAGYDVKQRSDHSVQLCPTCFANREGLA